MAVLLAEYGMAGESGVVERQMDGACDGLGQRVVEHSEGTLRQRGVDVHQSVPVACIRTPQMDDVAVEDLPVLLIPADDVAYGLPCLLSVVETRAAVACLHAAAVVLEHQGLIDIEMLAEWLDGGCRASAMILSEGHEAPATGLRTFPCAVVVELTGVDDLSIAGQRPVDFLVADAGLGGAVEPVEVGDVEIDSLLAHAVVEADDLLVLVPL